MASQGQRDGDLQVALQPVADVGGGFAGPGLQLDRAAENRARAVLHLAHPVPAARASVQGSSGRALHGHPLTYSSTVSCGKSVVIW